MLTPSDTALLRHLSDAHRAPTAEERIARELTRKPAAKGILARLKGIAKTPAGRMSGVRTPA